MHILSVSGVQLWLKAYQNPLPCQHRVCHIISGWTGPELKLDYRQTSRIEFLPAPIRISWHKFALSPPPSHVQVNPPPPNQLSQCG